MASARDLRQEHAEYGSQTEQKARMARLEQRWRGVVGEENQITLGTMAFVRS